MLLGSQHRIELNQFVFVPKIWSFVWENSTLYRRWNFLETIVGNLYKKNSQYALSYVHVQVLGHLVTISQNTSITSFSGGEREPNSETAVNSNILVSSYSLSESRWFRESVLHKAKELEFLSHLFRACQHLVTTL